MTKQMPRWPLFLIASPAAVAVWSGWVGLGGLCGFGIVHPLPGIAGGFELNTAITLPIGVESYGAYALGAWLTPGTPDTARSFARWSAIAALALGMCGQVLFHVLSAAHATRAPWPVVVLVACLPVVTLGFGAALTHLLRAPAAPADAPVPPGLDAAPAVRRAAGPGPPGTVPASAPVPAPAPAPAGGNGHEPAARVFAADLAAGNVPSIRRIRAGMHVGQPRAREIQRALEALTLAGQPIAQIRRDDAASPPAAAGGAS